MRRGKPPAVPNENTDRSPCSIPRVPVCRIADARQRSFDKGALQCPRRPRPRRDAQLIGVAPPGPETPSCSMSCCRACG